MSKPTGEIPEPWRPRFGLIELLLVTLIFCMLAAAIFYWSRGLEQGGHYRLAFVLITVTAPLLAVVAIGAVRLIRELLTRRD
jgi:hypothetical protein